MIAQDGTRMLVILIVALLGVGVAAAGTADDPEIADATGDGTLDAFDIVATWFQEGPAHLNVTMAVAETPPSPGLQACTHVSPACVYAGIDVRYQVHFAIADAAGVREGYAAMAWFNNTEQFWEFRIFTPDGDALGVQVPYGVGETDLAWSLPFALLGIPPVRDAPVTITHVRSTVDTLACSGAGPPGCVPVGVDDGPAPNGTRDVAPDSGYGSDFNLTYTPPPARAPTPSPTATPSPTPPPAAPEETPSPQPTPTQATAPQQESDGSSFPLQEEAPGVHGAALVLTVTAAVALRRRYWLR